MKQFIVRLLTLPMFLSAVAAAQAQNLSDCDCVLPLQTQGQVEFVRGVVRASSQNGLEPAFVGTPLPGGSQLLVGPASAARADFTADCSLDLEANTELTVTELQYDLCVRISSKAQAAIFGPYPVIAGYAAFGIWSLTGGDDQVSD